MIDENSKFEFKEGVSPLRHIRETLGFTREQFGNRIGVTGTSLYRWETGRSEPMFTLAQIKKLEEEIARLNLRLADLPDYLGPPTQHETN